MQADEGEGESDSMVRTGPSSAYNPRRAGGAPRSRALVLLVVALVVVFALFGE